MKVKKGINPNFRYEKYYWQRGHRFVVGVDEVGRGAFAGPIVVGAVTFSPAPQIKNWTKNILSLGINDSKLLNPRKRQELAKEIKKNCLWAISEIGVTAINNVGIGKATSMAIRKVIAELISKICRLQAPDSKQILIKEYKALNKKNLKFENWELEISKRTTFVLLDTFHIKYLRGVGLHRQKAIKSGDRKSISIAAASIVAKVHRDKLMQGLAKKYKLYEWGRNKGYGTRQHLEAIKKYGVCRLHRRQFVKTYFGKSKINIKHRYYCAMELQEKRCVS